MTAIFLVQKLLRDILNLDIDKSKDGPVSIQPKDIEEVIKFSKLSKKDQKNT